MAQMEIGTRLKQLVEFKGVNKSDLARRMNMSEQNLYKIFKKNSLDTSLLCAFAQELGVSVDYFFSDQPKGPLTHLNGYALKAEPSPEYANLPQDVQDYIQRLQKEIAYLKEINLLKDNLLRVQKSE